MCGIIGYSGYRPAVPLLIEGLRRLEYRGYDSSGVAFVKGSGIEVRKAAGKLTNLENKLDDSTCMLATAGIGHTRWAMRGGTFSLSLSLNSQYYWHVTPHFVAARNGVSVFNRRSSL